jgi:hypothetical protein
VAVPAQLVAVRARTRRQRAASWEPKAARHQPILGFLELTESFIERRGELLNAKAFPYFPAPALPPARELALLILLEPQVGEPIVQLQAARRKCMRLTCSVNAASSLPHWSFAKTIST